MDSYGFTLLQYRLISGSYHWPGLLQWPMYLPPATKCSLLCLMLAGDCCQLEYHLSMARTHHLMSREQERKLLASVLWVELARDQQRQRAYWHILHEASFIPN